MPTKIKCDCTASFPDSLWSYCDDDWYCPQCSHCLCWVWSKREQYPEQSDSAPGSDRELWIYPEDAPSEGSPPRFLMHFKLYRPDENRSLIQVSPEFVPPILNPPGDFSVSVHEPADGEPRIVELIPIRSARSFQLPDEGKTYSLRLEGEFPTTTISLRVCNAPILSWIVEGRGIGRPREDDTKSWLVLRNQGLEVKLTLTTRNAPVKLAAEVLETKVAIKFDEAPLTSRRELVLVNGLGSGYEISAHAHGSWTIRIDFKKFTRENQLAHLKLEPPLVGWRGRIPDVTFRYAPSWVRLDPPEGLVIPVMYWGEIRSNDRDNHEDNPDDPQLPPVVGELKLTNEGETPIKLKQPVVVYEKAALGSSWLKVDWSSTAKTGDDNSFELQPDTSVAIFARIDLTGFDPETQRTKMEPGPRATVRVSAADKSDEFDTFIRVDLVLPRYPCDYPLAIDFGNSFSYAAILNVNLISRLQEIVLAVHGYCADEFFPTALGIRRFNSSQPLKSDFVIGRAAFRLSTTGDGAPLLPITDLKRWIGQDLGDGMRSISDDGPDPQDVRLSTLVQMFLYGIIRRAEAVLRGYYIAKIVVSYPAKLAPVARRRFEDIVQDLCQQISKDRETIGQPITYGTYHKSRETYGIDEANAVATGFVLERALAVSPFTTEEELKPSFVVAAFDLGGGSLDTALLRFKCCNPESQLKTFESEYLGIGGQADFGGDNVTVAVFELLLRRLAELVGADDSAIQLLKNIPTAFQYNWKAGLIRWSYDILWLAAEQLKQWLCDVDAGDDKPLHFRLPDSRSESIKRLKGLLDRYLAGPASAWISLQDVYNYKITDLRPDHHGRGNYCVGDRINDSVKELSKFASNHNVNIDYVVLGGGSSRLPLVKQLLRDKANNFDNAHIIFDPRKLKCLVAEGLVRTVEYIETEGRPLLARSGRHTTSALGVMNGTMPITLIPACSKVESEKMFIFCTADGRPFSPSKVTKNGRITIYADIDAVQGQRRKLIDFDISSIAGQLTPQSQAALTLDGDEDRVVLHVTVDSDKHYEFNLKTADPRNPTR